MRIRAQRYHDQYCTDCGKGCAVGGLDFLQCIMRRLDELEAEDDLQ